MSKVRICDRCEKKIPNKRGMRVHERGFKFNRFLLHTEEEYVVGEHDLCPDCMKDFIAFMDGAEIVHKENKDGI